MMYECPYNNYKCPYSSTEDIITELEKVKSEIQNLYTISICGATPYYSAIMVDEILDKRIEELKGE